MGIGIILLFIFPDDPERTKYLNERERELAIKRIYVDQPQVSSSFFFTSSLSRPKTPHSQIRETKEEIDRDLIRRGLLNINTVGAIW